MIAAFFEIVLRTSLSAIPLILVVFALTPLLRGHYSPQSKHILWLMISTRLLLPVYWPIVPLFSFGANEPLIHATDNMNEIAKAFEGLETANTSPNLFALSDHITFSLAELLTLIWIVGIVVYIIVHINAHLRFNRCITHCSHHITDKNILRLLKQCLIEQNISKPISLHTCTFISTPLLIGGLKPRILIPDQAISDNHILYILRHELAHYSRHDIWYKYLLFIVGSLHWFNPFVWLMMREAENDMEIACDAYVLKISGIETRKEYGMSMLLFVKPNSTHKKSLSTCYFGGRKHVRQRFEVIMDTRNKKRGTSLSLLMLLALILSLAMVGCSSLSVNDTEQSIKTVDADIISDASDNSNVNNTSDLANMQLSWPVPDCYSISLRYGVQDDSVDYVTGIKISNEGIENKTIVASEAGTVSLVNTEYTDGVGFGQYIIIEHDNGLSTLYGHLKSISVVEGQVVESRQAIGTVGDTGYTSEPALHFEVRVDDQSVNPELYLLPTSDNK